MQLPLGMYPHNPTRGRDPIPRAMGAMLPTLLLTRPQASAEDFAKQAQWPGRVVISPVMKVVLRQITPPAPGCGVVFTSQHGVRAVAEATQRRDWPVWCVGPGTLAAARAAGFVDLRGGGGTAETLIAQLCAARPMLELVHFSGAHVTTDLAGRLNAAGLRARAVVSYDQLEQRLNADACACLNAPGNVVLLVFSPRSAALLAQQWRELPAQQARLHLIAISAAAAQRLDGVFAASMCIAQTPDQAGMLAALGQVQATLEPDQNPR